MDPVPKHLPLQSFFPLKQHLRQKHWRWTWHQKQLLQPSNPTFCQQSRSQQTAEIVPSQPRTHGRKLSTLLAKCGNFWSINNCPTEPCHLSKTKNGYTNAPKTRGNQNNHPSVQTPRRWRMTSLKVSFYPQLRPGSGSLPTLKEPKYSPLPTAM